MTESLKAHTRPLCSLALGEKVFIQNQQGNHPTKWDRSGTVVELLNHDQYRIKVDGSGRLTLRNRRFLRSYTAVSHSISYPVAPDQIPIAEVNPTRPGSPGSGSDLLDTRCRETPNTYEESPSAALPQHEHEATNTSPSPQEDGANLVDGHLPATAPGGSVPDMLHTQAGTGSLLSEVNPHVAEPQSRPRRECRRPKQYEPESGKWI